MNNELWAALCLVLVIEGLIPAVAPDLYRRLALSAAQTDRRSIRTVGLLLMVVGALSLWFIRH